MQPLKIVPQEFKAIRWIMKIILHVRCLFILEPRAADRAATAPTPNQMSKTDCQSQSVNPF